MIILKNWRELVTGWTKEDLEKLSGMKILDWQWKVLNKMLELHREGKCFVMPIRTTRSSVIKLMEKIYEKERNNYERKDNR